MLEHFGPETVGVVETGHLHDLAGERHHVSVEAGIPQAVVAPEEIGLAVIVDKDRRVDISERTRHQRPSQSILVRAGRTVGDSHSYAVDMAGGVLGADIPIPLAVALHRLRGPGVVALLGPRECGCGDGGPAIGPVDHIGARVELPVLHLEILGVVLVMVGEEIHRVVVYKRCRVGGKPRVYGRILSRRAYHAHRCGGE